MYIGIGVILVLILFIARLVNSALVVSVKRLKNIDEFLEPVEKIEDVEFIEACKEIEKWASEKGFVKDIFFLLHAQNSGMPIKCASWWSESNHCYLLFYLAEEGKILKKATDFHSRFKSNVSLTTGSTVDGLLLPRLKNDFMQCLVNVSIEEQFNRHIKSTESIIKKHNLSINFHKYDLFPVLRHAIKAQAEYIMELPLWKHRGFYWFFVRRHILKYRTY